MAPVLPQRSDRHRPRWRRAAPGWLISISFHTALLLILGAITWVVLRPPPPDRLLALGDAAGDSDDGGGAGGDTPNAGGASSSLGQTPSPPANTVAAPMPAMANSALSESLAEMPQPTVASEANGGSDALTRALTHGTGSDKGPGVGPGRLPGVAPGIGPFLGGRQGLDIVLVIDATDSMTPYIEQSKKRLNDIVQITRGLVSNARFGVVAFKDYGDDYGPNACRFTKITDKADDTRKFLDTIMAGGGGDIPEPIHEALALATDKRTMGWLPGRKNVIILISDAPVHASHRNDAYLLARQFIAGPLQGTINVIDTGGTGTGDASMRRNAPLQDLKQISTEGKGSIFLLDDEEAFYRHLIISIFGERYRQDVETIIAKYVRPN